MRIEASNVARITSGLLVGADCVAHGISFDSRVLVNGQAFVAIVGDSDGHDFLRHASDNGATLAIVNRGRSVDYITCVEVDDTVVALGQVAHELVQALPAFAADRVIGITGSAGKTSTKDLVAAVLAHGFDSSFAPSGSLNNDIGVPITILNAPDDCDAMVLEMGMRGFGEIERLCNIAQPFIGVLTNIGDAHGERLGGRDGVAQAKFELLDSLPSEGIAILNTDDDEITKRRSHVYSSILTYGQNVGADVRWSIESVNDNGCALASFKYDGEVATGQIPFPGEHMVANAAAAVAVGVSCGMSLDAAVHALGSAVGHAGRMTWRTGANGMRILDDSYNANTLSMKAALRAIAQLDGSKMAVLGAMSEVPNPQQAHAEVLAEAQLLNIEVLPFETDAYGMPAMSLSEVLERVQNEKPHIVVVKGSRAATTERVVRGLSSAN